MLKITSSAVAVNPLMMRAPRGTLRVQSSRSVSAAPQANLYVAHDGNDAWSGKLSAPNAGRTDGPLASLPRAQALVREMKGSQASSQPITVMVRGGKYFFEDTLVLGPEDSGNPEATITYAAYPGEKPILSGGRKVSGWKVHKGKILVAALPGAKGGQLEIPAILLKRRTSNPRAYAQI